MQKDSLSAEIGPVSKVRGLKVESRAVCCVRSGWYRQFLKKEGAEATGDAWCLACEVAEPQEATPLRLDSSL